MMAALKCFPAKRATKFTEMLCCHERFSNIARASRISNRIRSQTENLLLELYVRPGQSPGKTKIQIKRFCEFAKLKMGYKRAHLVALVFGRKAFFPSAGDLRQATLKIKNWAGKFPAVHVPKFIGPINMAKAWEFSDQASQNNKNGDYS